MAVDSDGGKYAAHIDPNANDSHALMIRMIGGGKRVLDIGCWTGDMSAEVGRWNPRVVGIEIDQDAAEQAKKVLDEVVVADVTTLDFERAFGRDAFDVIVFGDVLEHVTEPTVVLRNSLACLAPRGFVVASIPNVAHGSVRISLLNGSFDYTPTGLLDETHLRFFTRESVFKLFEGAGMAVVDVQRTIVDPVHAMDRPIDESTVPPELLAELRADIEAMTYQFVVKAVRDDGAHALSNLYDRAEALERQVAALAGGRPDAVSVLSPVLRVAGLASPASNLDLHHLRDILERELATRFRAPIDVRVFRDLAQAPPGWGPHCIVRFGVEPGVGDRPHLRSLAFTDVDPAAVDPELDAASALGLLATRLSEPAERAGHVELLRATGRLPDGQVLTIVLHDESVELAEQLAVSISVDNDFDGVVVFTSESAHPSSARFEALWPSRCVVARRPLHADDLVATFAGSAAVLSASAFDRAVAASVGVRTASTRSPHDVMVALDGSASGAEVRAELVLALDRALDSVLDGLQASVEAADVEELDRLRSTLAELQQRIARERVLFADYVAELQARATTGEAVVARVAALAAVAADRRDAIVQLQADYRRIFEQQQPHATARRSLVRRAAGKLRRTLRRR